MPSVYRTNHELFIFMRDVVSSEFRCVQFLKSKWVIITLRCVQDLLSAKLSLLSTCTSVQHQLLEIYESWLVTKLVLSLTGPILYARCVQMMSWTILNYEQTAQASSIRGTGRTNNSNQVIGTWVLGIYKSKQDKRFIDVDDRRALILMPIIQSHFEPVSLIWTYEWASYRRLSNLGCTHQSVNHSENLINSFTGVQTHGVERAWRE